MAEQTEKKQSMFEGFNPFDFAGLGGFTDSGSAVSGGPFSNRNDGINFFGGGGSSQSWIMWAVIAFVVYLLFKAVK